MPPTTDCILTEPAPNGGSTHVRHESLLEDLLANVGDSKIETGRGPGGVVAHRRGPLPGTTREAGKAGLTPAARFVLQAGKQNHLHHLQTIWRGVIEAGGEHIILKIVGSEEDDLGANDVTLR